MKKLFSVFLGAFLLLGAVVTTASADSVKGQKYYLKFMKDFTGMKGDKFVDLHTQAEWKALFDGNAEKFVEEFSAKYPDWC